MMKQMNKIVLVLALAGTMGNIQAADAESRWSQMKAKMRSALGLAGNVMAVGPIGLGLAAKMIDTCRPYCRSSWQDPVTIACAIGGVAATSWAMNKISSTLLPRLNWRCDWYKDAAAVAGIFAGQEIASMLNYRTGSGDLKGVLVGSLLGAAVAYWAMGGIVNEVFPKTDKIA